MLVQSLLESAVAVGTLSIPEVSQILLSLQKVRPFQAGRNNVCSVAKVIIDLPILLYISLFIKELCIGVEQAEL